MVSIIVKGADREGLLVCIHSNEKDLTLFISIIHPIAMGTGFSH